MVSLLRLLPMMSSRMIRWEADVAFEKCCRCGEKMAFLRDHMHRWWCSRCFMNDESIREKLRKAIGL